MNKEEVKCLLWVNNEVIIKSNLNKQKPCLKLGWCPYGQLVEAFNLREKRDEKISCKLFGHDCPMFYHAEDVAEDKKKELYEKSMRRENDLGNKK